MQNLNDLMAYAMTFVGLPYVIGGQHPSVGYDCSGLVVELCIAGGALPHGTDLSAQGLFDNFKSHGQCADIDRGVLLFFGKDLKHISHVGWAINDHVMIEAGGGDFSTFNVEHAIKKGAFVRFRPIKFRKDFLLALRPKYGWEP